MRTIWLHRIKHHLEVSLGLLKQGQLTIGFSDFANEEFLRELDSSGWEALEDAFASEWGEDSRKARIRYNLWRFVQEMKQGDWVVVPQWEEFSIYKIIGESSQPIGSLPHDNLTDWHNNPVSMRNGFLHRENGELIDLGFFWQVKPIATNLARYDYADAALTARMKIYSTNANISDLRENVQKALDSFAANSPLNLHLQLMESMVPQVLATLRQELNPDKMERLVKWYFQRIGAAQVAIPAKNASGKVGDADVIATFEAIKTIIYVQVKFHRDETCDWALEQIDNYAKDRELADTDNGYSHISWVISTCDNYSADSLIISKEKKIKLFDGQTFTKMLLEAGMTGIDKAFE
ncbi:MAG TPA: restriction endonuclease [Hymenobacter sp.]|uniref:restriction endonuclease n=1 Tax=Hymenobacter sp. TaxID=1898978 RepID=UPI002D80C8E1|nr:restriction endonuclease [Hymenobacter sp.]HET9503819.1 restriction endonuclease [Hymenobacter sp.]